MRLTKLPICLLGKKVLLDHDEEFIVKYQEAVSKKRSACLLFQKDQPMIYAEINHFGEFSDSFFIDEHETDRSQKVLKNYWDIKKKRKSNHLEQSDIKHALKSIEIIDDDNRKLLKAVKDEYLQDMKNNWPSRLITLERMQGTKRSSIIVQGLESAIIEANPKKAFQFLRFHRLEEYIPYLFVENHQSTEGLIDEIISYYEMYEQHILLDDLLMNINDVIHLEKHKEIKELLLFYYFKRPIIFKKRFVNLYNRAKKEYSPKQKKWLIQVLNAGGIGIPKSMKEEIISLFKKRP